MKTNEWTLFVALVVIATFACAWAWGFFAAVAVGIGLLVLVGLADRLVRGAP